MIKIFNLHLFSKKLIHKFMINNYKKYIDMIKLYDIKYIKNNIFLFINFIVELFLI